MRGTPIHDSAKLEVVMSCSATKIPRRVENWSVVERTYWAFSFGTTASMVLVLLLLPCCSAPATRLVVAAVVARKALKARWKMLVQAPNAANSMEPSCET